MSIEPHSNIEEPDNNQCKALLNLSTVIILDLAVLLFVILSICYCNNNFRKLPVKYRTMYIIKSSSDAELYGKIKKGRRESFGDTICRWTRSADTDMQEFVLYFKDDE